MNVTTYVYDANRTLAPADPNLCTVFTYEGSGPRPSPFTAEQNALFALADEATRELSRQWQQAFHLVGEDQARWPAERAALEGLLARLAQRFLDHLGRPPCPDVVVKPPE